MNYEKIRSSFRLFPFLVALIAATLVFKSCDQAKESDAKRSTQANKSDQADQAADDEHGDTVDEPSGSAGDDEPSYELEINLDSYADSDVTSFRFYIDNADATNQTFLQEVPVGTEFSFSNPVIKIQSKDVKAIAEFAGSEACVMVLARRSGVSSELSLPYCFNEWD